jgi:hypothetical protein
MLQCCDNLIFCHFFTPLLFLFLAFYLFFIPHSSSGKISLEAATPLTTTTIMAVAHLALVVMAPQAKPPWQLRRPLRPSVWMLRSVTKALFTSCSSASSCLLLTWTHRLL